MGQNQQSTMKEKVQAVNQKEQTKQVQKQSGKQETSKGTKGNWRFGNFEETPTYTAPPENSLKQAVQQQ